MDVTAIQYHIARIKNIEAGTPFMQGEVTGDNFIDIDDATMIQLYVSKHISKFPVEETDVITLAKAVSKTATASLTDALILAKIDLDNYYTYSSYDQYMALKKACLNYKNTTMSVQEQEKAVADLTAKQEALYDIAGGGNDNPIDPSGDITVYFTNSENWSTVKAYVWGSAGKIASWPGTEMTYVKTNSYNQKIYSISFSFEDYQNIIFTNGSTQTVDIALTGENNVGYYISGSSGGKLTCETYKYS